MTGSIKGHLRKLNLYVSNALNGDLQLLFVGIMPSVRMCLSGCLRCFYQDVYDVSIRMSLLCLSGCLSCIYQDVYMFAIILLSTVSSQLVNLRFACYPPCSTPYHCLTDWVMGVGSVLRGGEVVGL